MGAVMGAVMDAVTPLPNQQNAIDSDPIFHRL
jgi:hypothetical protein